MCHLHKYEEKTGTHSAIKIRRFLLFHFVIYFCTTRNRESCCFSSAVEHFLGKEEVPGSSPETARRKRVSDKPQTPSLFILFVLLSRNHFRICDSRKIKTCQPLYSLTLNADAIANSNDFAALQRQKLCFRTTFRPVSTLRQSALDFALPLAARPSLRRAGGDLVNS